MQRVKTKISYTKLRKSLRQKVVNLYELPTYLSSNKVQVCLRRRKSRQRNKQKYFSKRIMVNTLIQNEIRMENK